MLRDILIAIIIVLTAMVTVPIIAAVAAIHHVREEMRKLN